MSHLCPVPARIPRACTTSSNPKATKHVNDCEWICCQSEWVKPVILPILNVFGLPKKKIPAQRQSPPPVLEEALSDIISDDAFQDLQVILVKYGPCFCTLKSHTHTTFANAPTAGYRWACGKAPRLCLS